MLSAFDTRWDSSDLRTLASAIEHRPGAKELLEVTFWDMLKGVLLTHIHTVSHFISRGLLCSEELKEGL